MNVKRALVACVLLLLSASASAQSFFFGGSFGHSDIDESVAENLITSGSIDGGSFGFGAAWRFTRNLAARVEWEQFPIDTSDASLVLIGLQYSF